MQTLAIYRRLLVKSRLREINATGPRRDGRGREMFFLLRMAFWLGLVLVLLPRDKTPESDKAPQIGASEADLGRDRGGVGHEPILQAPAGGL